MSVERGLQLRPSLVGRYSPPLSNHDRAPKQHPAASAILAVGLEEKGSWSFPLSFPKRLPLELAFERHIAGSTIHNYPEALWWAIVTVTTVGYGDTYPVTAAGRGVAVVLMLVGIGLIGVLTATIASFFVQENADEEKHELIARLDRIEAMLAGALSQSDGTIRAVAGGQEEAFHPEGTPD